MTQVHLEDISEKVGLPYIPHRREPITTAMGNCFSSSSSGTGTAAGKPSENAVPSAKPAPQKYSHKAGYVLPASDTPRPQSAGVAAAAAAEQRKQDHDEKMRPKRKLN